MDETKPSVKGVPVYVWSSVDMDPRELLVLEASYRRSCLNVLTLLKKALRMCNKKPVVVVGEGPCYRWALGRLGLEYRYERFFRYLKESTMVLHHKVGARDHLQGIKSLNLLTTCYKP